MCAVQCSRGVQPAAARTWWTRALVAFLAVWDDGPGIAASEQRHLFDRFYRADGGTAFGSGLGLAIASELAARMDGRLAVRSQPGETVFTCFLPPVDASEQDASREKGAAAPV